MLCIVCFDLFVFRKKSALAALSNALRDTLRYEPEIDDGEILQDDVQIKDVALRVSFCFLKNQYFANYLSF